MNKPRSDSAFCVCVCVSACVCVRVCVCVWCISGWGSSRASASSSRPADFVQVRDCRDGAVLLGCFLPSPIQNSAHTTAQWIRFRDSVSYDLLLAGLCPGPGYPARLLSHRWKDCFSSVAGCFGIWLGLNHFQKQKMDRGFKLPHILCVSVAFTESSQRSRRKIRQEVRAPFRRRQIYAKVLKIYLFWNTETASELERMSCWNEHFLWQNNYPVVPQPAALWKPATCCAWPVTNVNWILKGIIFPKRKSRTIIKCINF